MRIVFMGTPSAAVPSLQRLIADGHEIAAVYTQPDRPAGRGQRMVMSPVKQAAMQHGIQVRQPDSIRSEDEITKFVTLKADCAVVVAYGRILPQEMLDAFPFGAINLHFSLLPKYRGAAPVNWAIVNGETVTGVTTMKMDAGLDTGDILLQRRLEIGDRETSTELLERSAAAGAELLSFTLRDIDAIKPSPQNSAEASYAPMLRRSDGLIDWGLDAIEIERRIRGFQPFPGTFTTFRGKRLTIHGAMVRDADISEEHPGTIVDSGKLGITVSCGGPAAIVVTELQPEGRNRLTAADFANGFHVRAGEKFGQ